MSEDEEYRKLPTEDKCVHKLWKARLMGYEEASNLFKKIDNDKSPEFAKFAPIIKKMVSDSHAACQEKGLEAALVFIENYASAGRTAHEVLSAVVQKSIGSVKLKIKDLSYQIVLMYIEIEKHDVVLEEVLKGLEQKNPKIVLGCVTALTMALKEFGSKVISVKQIVKKIPVLLSDRDKSVRDEGKSLTVELYRWIGPALKSQLSTLQPLQLTELETEFSKLGSQNASPSRYLRSEMLKRAKMEVEIGTMANDDSDDGNDNNSVDLNEENGIEDLDPYESAEPSNILEKLPNDFYTSVESKKWQDRKSVLETLEGLTKAPKLANGDYFDLVKALKKIIAKDSNVLVIALAAKCLKDIAMGLKKRFHPYASNCVPVLLEKFKEKKQNVVQNVRDALDAIFVSTNFEAIVEDVKEALGCKNPNVKSETALFLARCFSKSLPTTLTLNKKLLKSYMTPLIKNINESDPTVRDSSAEALGTAMKLVTEKFIVPYLTEIDNLKMAKVKEYAEKAVLTAKVVKEPCAAKSKPTGKAVIKKPVSSTSTLTSSSSSSQIPTVKKSLSKERILETNHAEIEDDTQMEYEIKTNSVSEKIDLNTLISENLIDEMSDKNWKTRNEALLKIHSILTDKKKVKANISPLMDSLSKRLIDSNSKIAQCAFNICELLGEALGYAGKSYVRLLFPGFLQALGDSKQWIRTSSRSCLDIWSEQCQYEIFDSEMFYDALKAGSPILRTELWSWLAVKLPIIPSKNVSKDELVLCLPILFNNLEDRSADVRKNAQEVVFPFMLHLGFEKMSRTADKLKPGSKSVVVPLLERNRAKLPPPKPVTSNSTSTTKNRLESQKSTTGIKTSATTGTTSNKIPVSAKSLKKMPSSSSTSSIASAAASVSGGSNGSGAIKKKEETAENFAILVANNALKTSRINDENKSKVIRWNPLLTRDEMCDILKNQMIQANVDKNLLTNLFHVDFKYHLKALETLAAKIHENVPALISNLDLLLKWLSFRFNDTNPSVILKGLEYLQLVLDVLIANDYRLIENEALYIVPYLLIKIGDPKDAVRNNVRTILRQITRVYPSSRLFLQVMEGLKTKNSRQRAECLEELENLIDISGLCVCQPNPSIAFKEIAKHISDRDNSVRNAALNCISAAYYLEGDHVLKLIGHIADKEMSLLEERLKRYVQKKEKPPVQLKTPTLVKSTPSNACIKSNNLEIFEVPNGENDECAGEERNLQDDLLVDQMMKLTMANQNHNNDSDVSMTKNNTLELKDVMCVEKINGPYSLDWNYINLLESDKLECRVPVFIEPDTDFLHEPMHYNNEAKIALDKYSDKMPQISEFIANTQNKVYVEEKKVKNEFQETLSKIRGSDLASSIEAMKVLETFLLKSDINQQDNHENDTIQTLSFMLKWLANSSSELNPTVKEAYHLVLNNLNLFYENRGRKLSIESIYDLIYELINLLAQNKFEKHDKLFRIANLQCTTVIENSNHTSAVCALIRLLHKLSGSCTNESRAMDLSLKCLWRIIKKLQSWENDLDFELIFYEISIFFRDYPMSFWSKDFNTPIRTIKTIVYTIIKMKNYSVLVHFVSVPKIRETELYSYTIKVLENLKEDDDKKTSLSKDSQKMNAENHVNNDQINNLKQDYKSKLNEYFFSTSPISKKF